MKLLIQLMFIFVSYSVSGIERYDYFNTDQNLTYNISISENTYQISYSVYSGHQSYLVNISSGYFLQYGDTIIMHDIFNDFHMLAVYQQFSSITIIRGFEFLKSKKFIAKIGQNFVNSPQDYLTSPCAVLMQTNYVDSVLSSHCKKMYKGHGIKLRNGIYHDTYTAISERGNVLNIDIENNDYAFNVGDSILSYGKLELAGNYIIFLDNSFQTSFLAQKTAEDEFVTIKFPSCIPLHFKLIDNETQK